MKVLKMALAAATLIASTAASASVTQTASTVAPGKVSTCYYQYSVITEDAIYDYYTCYSNGDGSY